MGTLLLSNAAFAEERKSTMNYYVRQHEPKTPPAVETPEKTPEIISQSAADKAWERYKSLAAGTSKSTENTERKVATPTKPTVAKPTPPGGNPKPSSTGGLGALLQQYQSSKSKRSQMNTIIVNPPNTVIPSKTEGSNP